MYRISKKNEGTDQRNQRKGKVQISRNGLIYTQGFSWISWSVPRVCLVGGIKGLHRISKENPGTDQRNQRKAKVQISRNGVIYTLGFPWFSWSVPRFCFLIQAMLANPRYRSNCKTKAQIREIKENPRYRSGPWTANCKQNNSPATQPNTPSLTTLKLCQG